MNEPIVIAAVVGTVVAIAVVSMMAKANRSPKRIDRKGRSADSSGATYTSSDSGSFRDRNDDSRSDDRSDGSTDGGGWGDSGGGDGGGGGD